MLVQEVVVQVGQLFLAPPTAVGVGLGQPLLLKQASDDSSSSELLFSPLPGQERSHEAEAWQVSVIHAYMYIHTVSTLILPSRC